MSDPTVDEMKHAMAEQLLAERRAQYMQDRTEALVNLTAKGWKVFCLRWNLPPPPKGWSDLSAMLGAMHKIRLLMPEIPPEEKLRSAQYCVSHFIQLPPGQKLKDGVLTGATYAVEPTLPD